VGGLSDIVAFCTRTLCSHRDILIVYGEEELCASVQCGVEDGEWRMDPDDDCAYTLAGLLQKYADSYSDGDIHEYWHALSVAPNGSNHLPALRIPDELPDSLESELRNDLDHFNIKFGTLVRLQAGRIGGRAELPAQALEELERLICFYQSRVSSGGMSATSKPVAIGSGSELVDDSSLRFSEGDRVICLGMYWAPGKVIGTQVSDPEDITGPKLPYMVKLDAHTGYKEPTPVICDDDTVIRREVCFDAFRELEFVKVAAPMNVQKELRFEKGVRIVCRIADTIDGLSVWAPGVVQKKLAELPPPHCLPHGRCTVDRVPYLVKLDDGERLFYVHRDEHTLLRLERYAPQERHRGIAPRFEVRSQVDGSGVRFDHQTMRGQNISTLANTCDDLIES